MNNKFIKQLAQASYTKADLDQVKVGRISKSLNKRELKEYIKILKALEKQKNVYVYLPNTMDKESGNEFKKLFPDKNVHLRQDETLMAGIKIVDNDMVYDQNLKSNIDNLVNFLDK